MRMNPSPSFSRFVGAVPDDFEVAPQPAPGDLAAAPLQYGE